MTTMTRYSKWMAGAFGVTALALAIVSCGGTGGGSGQHGDPTDQFVLNSNNAGRLILNINPATVDANKSDRIGLVATLSDRFGNPIAGIVIRFVSDLDDISFLPGTTDPATGRQIGIATTDSHGNADIIAVAGTTPTSTGAIIGTGAIFAIAPEGFGLIAQQQVTLLDVGFIDADAFGVIPMSMDLVEPAPGTVVFFSIVGGTPPYHLLNEISGIGTATLSQHCVPGCTENGGLLCVGSPCQSDSDCNLGGSADPANVCLGPIKRCLASCGGTNCAGSLCEVDADCNDGASAPANVCKDSGQSIAYIISSAEVAGTHTFTVTDSAGDSKAVSVNVTFVCGNGVARGDEQCDVGDLRGNTCADLGFTGGGTLLCDDTCKFDTTNCSAGTPQPGGGTPGPGGTGTATPVVATPSPTPTVTTTSSATPGAAVNLVLALLTNGFGDNGNGTKTTVIASTVTDGNGNPVADNTAVTFAISGPPGAVISSPSHTNTDPPCDVTAFEANTMVMVVNQPGVAHSCVTYPSGQSGGMRTVTSTSGTAVDMQVITLP